MATQPQLQAPEPGAQPAQTDKKNVRDPKLYFSDGDIVLTADNAAETEKVHFRVHKLFINHHSCAFRAIVTIPPSANMETYDGVMVMHVSERAEDLRTLLEFIYSIYPASIARPKPYTGLGWIAGALKIAHKYEVEPLYNKLLDIVKDEYPEELDDWDRRRDVIHGRLCEAFACCQMYDDDEFTCDPQPAIAIALATAHNLPGVYARAMYDLSRFPPHLVEDRLLTKYDLIMMSRGAHEVYVFVRDCIRYMDRNTPCKEGCRWNEHQKVILEELEKRQVDIVEEMRKQILRARSHGASIKLPLCINCRETVADKLERIREAAFYDLPKYFKLP